jgi:transcription elongation factor GreA
VQSRKPGVYVVELGAPLPSPPLELTRVGKWLERLPGLRLDGERPTSKALTARIASFWWPDSAVLFAGSTDRSIGGRVAALVGHVPGDRQPHAEGQWLHLLRGLDRSGTRIWWAETDAPEEYLDAVFDAFGDGRIPPPGRPAGALALPWANLRRPTGERQPHGITGAVLPEEPKPPEPARRVVDMPPGDADGARPDERSTGTTRRAPSVARARPARPASGTASPTRPRTPMAPGRGVPEPIHLSQSALDRLRAELDDLTQVKRREVVARIKTARELGDLRENADYTAAREEQSFLEGRVQALEDRLRRAVVVEESGAGRVVLGSAVRVETDGDELTYTIVGSTEADPAAGRLSSASPVGAALLGAVPGAEVEVRTPRGPVRYRVLAVD